MTSTTHPTTLKVGRSASRTGIRQVAGRLAAFIRWFRTQVAEIAASGQLGRDAETEIGRRTGARI